MFRASLSALRPHRASLLFALHTTVAAVVSLVCAATLDVAHPWWAAMTVWLVAQPTRGLFIERCIARLTGTAVGALIGGALLVAFFNNPPVLLLALALWVMLCAGVGSTLRHFRSYAAVLAGYTASVVALFSLAEGEPDFTQAYARMAATTIGILVSTASSYFFSAPAMGVDWQERVERMVNDCVGWCNLPAGERADPTGRVRQKALLREASALEKALDDDVAGSLTARRLLQARRLDLWQAMAAMAEAGVVTRAHARPGDRLLADGLTDWRLVSSAAARPATALGMAGTVWLVTGWVHGPIMVMTAAIFSSLFSSNERASHALRGVMFGTLSGALLGMIFRALATKAAGNDVVTVLMLMPFLALGAVLMSQPRTAKMAIDMNMVLLLVAQPAFPLPPLDGDVVGQAGAMLAGVACAWLSMYLYSADAAKQTRSRARRIRSWASALVAETSPRRRQRYCRSIVETCVLVASRERGDGAADAALACAGWAVHLQRSRLAQGASQRAPDAVTCTARLTDAANNLNYCVSYQRRSQ